MTTSLSTGYSSPISLSYEITFFRFIELSAAVTTSQCSSSAFW